MTPTNPKSYPVSKDLGCVVNLVSRSLCRSVALSLGLSVIPPLGDADTRKRKKNVRYKKGTKPEKRELTCGSAVYRI